MMDIEQLTLFLGWVTAINIGVLAVSAFAVVNMRDKVSAIHMKMFGIKKEEVLKGYFEYLGKMKILIILFNLVPYLVLRMVILG